VSKKSILSFVDINYLCWYNKGELWGDSMDREVEHAQKLRKIFLEERNKPFVQNEYYSVVMGIYYESYDSYIVTTENMYLDVPSIMEVTERGFFGPKKVRKEVVRKEPVGIYAVKTKNGIYEMVTGKKLSLTAGPNTLQCFGVNKLTYNCLDSVSKDLQLLESKPQCKAQYIKELLTLSERVKTSRQCFDEYEREKNNNLDYLRRYKLPNN